MEKKRRLIVAFVFLFFLALAAGWFFMTKNELKVSVNDTIKNPVSTIINSIAASPTPTDAPIPSSYTIPLRLPVFQSFNNCGPASLSMALSYFGINKTQAELGQAIRPYQIPGGDNDDKSVTLRELGQKAEEFGLKAYYRPNGSATLLKKFIAIDIVVVTRTWVKVNEDIGHYRVVRGYTETELIQDDSLQNKNLKYTYADFNAIWKKFNYEYLVLVPQDKVVMAERILGEDLNEKTAWQKAVLNSQNELASNPDDIYARFNLSVALYNTGNYEQSVKEFEQVESSLSFRTLWYQIEPIQAYYELENYNRVFQITDRILNNHNRAFSELYLIRGNIYLKQGNRDAARQEFEKALFYNKTLKEAQDSLASV